MNGAQLTGRVHIMERIRRHIIAPVGQIKGVHITLGYDGGHLQGIDEHRQVPGKLCDHLGQFSTGSSRIQDNRLFRLEIPFCRQTGDGLLSRGNGSLLPKGSPWSRGPPLNLWLSLMQGSAKPSMVPTCISLRKSAHIRYPCSPARASNSSPAVRL